tara:strand:+ start:4593 stop:4775 length:183 start_codon:yes stop_codon:yes gene_type:complete
MDDFLEYDEVKKTIKSLNLDDFSVEELNFYVEELKKEIMRVEEEITKKKQIKKNAEKLFG